MRISNIIASQHTHKKNAWKHNYIKNGKKNSNGYETQNYYYSIREREHFDIIIIIIIHGSTFTCAARVK
jgi:hypothetical protein